MDAAAALIGPGLDAVRADLLTVARQNDDTVLRGQSLYRVRDSKGKACFRAVRAFPRAF